MTELPFDLGGYMPGGPVLVSLEVAECIIRAGDVSVGRIVCCRADLAHLAATHSYVGCSCGHELFGHAGGGCRGKDSYGVRCSCPSFELSQECRESLERGEKL